MAPAAKFAAALIGMLFLALIISGCKAPDKPFMTYGKVLGPPTGAAEFCQRNPEHELCKPN